MNKFTEQLLLVRIQEGKDQKAFSKLYDLMIDPIYRFVYFKVNDKEVAEDLVADIFLKAWKGLIGDGQKVKHLKSYLYIIARTRVIDHYRSQAKKLDVVLEEGMNQENSEDLHELVSNKFEVATIKTLLNKLKDSYQEVIILRHVNELSLNEISKVLDKSAGATRVLLHRAEQALKREYEKNQS